MQLHWLLYITLLAFVPFAWCNSLDFVDCRMSTNNFEKFSLKTYRDYGKHIDWFKLGFFAFTVNENCTSHSLCLVDAELNIISHVYENRTLRAYHTMNIGLHADGQATVYPILRLYSKNGCEFLLLEPYHYYNGWPFFLLRILFFSFLSFIIVWFSRSKMKKAIAFSKTIKRIMTFISRFIYQLLDHFLLLSLLQVLVMNFARIFVDHTGILPITIVISKFFDNLPFFPRAILRIFSIASYWIFTAFLRIEEGTRLTAGLCWESFLGFYGTLLISLLIAPFIIYALYAYMMRFVLPFVDRGFFNIIHLFVCRSLCLAHVGFIMGIIALASSMTQTIFGVIISILSALLSFVWIRSATLHLKNTKPISALDREFFVRFYMDYTKGNGSGEDIISRYENIVSILFMMSDIPNEDFVSMLMKDRVYDRMKMSEGFGRFVLNHLGIWTEPQDNLIVYLISLRTKGINKVFNGIVMRAFFEQQVMFMSVLYLLFPFSPIMLMHILACRLNAAPIYFNLNFGGHLSQKYNKVFNANPRRYVLSVLKFLFEFFLMGHAALDHFSHWIGLYIVIIIIETIFDIARSTTDRTSLKLFEEQPKAIEKQAFSRETSSDSGLVSANSDYCGIDGGSLQGSPIGPELNFLETESVHTFDFDESEEEDRPFSFEIVHSNFLSNRISNDLNDGTNEQWIHEEPVCAINNAKNGTVISFDAFELDENDYSDSYG
ncbi:hypothetical protein PCE1_002681 [Barthelona sp. PCE]